MSRARIFNISSANMPKSRQFSLLVRLHARSITSIPSRRLPFGHCHQISHLRSISSSSNQRYASPAEDVPTWLNLREIARPAAMWLVPKGSKFNQQQLLDELPQLDNPSEVLPVVLFLVTPKLAHLFERNHSFLPRAINSIYGTSTRGALRQSIVAVVDALPIIGNRKRPREPEIDGSEGIAMCISPGFDVTPANDDDASLPLIRMIGKHPYFDGRQYLSVSCSAPVANTTFINGQQNTMFMQNWRNLDGQKWLSENKRHRLNRVDVPLYTLSTSNSLPVDMYSKVIKLTDPKVVLHSMGNIIRQVKAADGQELAASHELEKIVPEMLKKLQKTLPTGDIRVFALVYPHELGSDDPFKDRIWSTKRRQGEHLQYGDDSLKLLTLLARGARLYRVTSGGAGWGQKAGLLSLEPQTELGASVDAPKLPSFIFDTDEDIRMPGSADLFPPGHIVQFVATFHDTEGSKKDCVPMERAKKPFEDLPYVYSFNSENPVKSQLFCIGNTVLPETHQYTALENIEESSTEDNLGDETSASSQLFRQNQFGCLTSSALGFSVEYHSPSQKIQARMKKGDTSFDVSELNPNYKHSSLVELPNSYFVAQFRAGERPSSQSVQKYSGSQQPQAVQKRINVTSFNQGRELTKEESIIAACQRLRVIESVQKDSYLARKRIPFRRKKVGPLVRILPSDVKTIRKYESTSPPLEELGSPAPRQVVSGPLVRPISRKAPVPTVYECRPARATRPRKLSILSFKVRTPLSIRRLPDPTRDKSSGDECEYETTNSAPIRRTESGALIELRKIAPRKFVDLRNIGARSAIFRAFDKESDDLDSVYEDVDEEQAIKRMTEDL